MRSTSRQQRGPRADGIRAREAILRAAADLASIEGLEGITIGKLAQRLQMSKSGVITHFGSKEELQLATIDAAQAIYVAEIVQPALGVPPGLGRVQALVDGFLSYSERHVFPGGCFFGTTIVEHAARPGPIRERLARAHVDWIGMLRLFLDQARDQGELGADIDTNRIAFEMAALLTSADWSSTLHDEPSYLELARQAITELLDSITRPAESRALGAVGGERGLA